MKRIFSKKIITLLVAAFLLTGCGKKDPVITTIPETFPAEEVMEETQMNTELEEEKGDKSLEKVTADGKIETENTESTVNAYGDLEVKNYYDNHTKVKVIETVSERYFIGRENYENNVGYFNKYLTEDAGKLYIKKKMYLPDVVAEGTVYCSVSDENIAEIDGNALIGLRQGTFTLVCYDKDMNVLDEKMYIVSTFNDSVENIAKHLSIENKNVDQNYATLDMRDVHYCKEAVSTIMDMSYLLQMRGFTYDFSKEPDFGALNYNVTDEEKWNWTADAETIFDMNGGVCIQVAQLATYMLADDFEDWGVVMIEGRQGHIFNWFFEDGKYYVFDYTEVISDNCGRGYEFNERFGYKDYSSKVKVFDNLEDFKNWCITVKVDITQNYAVYMYSCQGHDYIATNINSVMSDSWGVVDGEKDEVLLCYQDIVLEDFEVFYLMETSNAEFVSIPSAEVPEEIPYGVYGRGEREYFYDYTE